MHAASLGFISFINAQGHEEVVRYDLFVQQLFKADTDPQMKLHAALGVAGEAGELADAIKKEIIYGKPADRANIVEELGDLRFYMQAVAQMYKISEQEILNHNGAKLSKRYSGLKYSDDAAIARADKKTDDPLPGIPRD